MVHTVVSLSVPSAHVARSLVERPHFVQGQARTIPRCPNPGGLHFCQRILQGHICIAGQSNDQICINVLGSLVHLFSKTDLLSLFLSI